MHRRRPVLPLFLAAAALAADPPAGLAQDAPPPLPAPSPAEDPPPPEPEAALVPEVQVTATSTRAAVGDVPFAVTVVDRREILDRQSRNVPEALLEEVGIFVQKTTHGQGSPILRGLIGKQTLLMIDDVRLNNSTYRGGPNQYLATVDVETVERIEVVRGPSSVLYGSDALGGVVRVLTRRAEPLAEGAATAGGRLAYRDATAEDSERLRIEGNVRSTGLGLLAGGSIGAFGDLRGGRHVDTQPFTGYDETDGDMAARLALGEGRSLDLVAQHVRQEGVRRPQFLVTGWRGTGSTRNAVWRIEEQERDLVAATLRAEGSSDLLRAVETTVSLHRQTERRFERRTGSDNLDRTNDDVTTPGVVVRATTVPHEAHRISWGLEWYRDSVSSDRVRTDVTTGARTDFDRGTFAGSATYTSAGAYVQDEARLTDRLRAVAGVRASRFRIDARDVDPDPSDATPLADFSESFSDVTGAAHLHGDLGGGFRAYTGISRGFRAPNVEDLTVFQVTSTSFDVPARDLDPETLTQWEMGLRAERDRVSGGVTWYRSHLRDLIDRVPTTYGGAATDGSGRAYTTRGNVGTARIDGLEADLRVLLGGGFSTGGNITFTRGTHRDTGEPLSKIPPTFGALWLRHESGTERRWYIEAVFVAADGQDRLSSADAADTRIPDGGTPGFGVLHIRGGLRLGAAARLDLAVENVLNRDYRFHGSGVNGAGRGLVLTLTLEF